MDFLFYTAKALQCDGDGFAVIDGKQPQKYRKAAAGGAVNAHLSSSFFAAGGGVTAQSTPGEQLDEIIDKMGTASAKAQKLP